jgi:hypothetical protein
MRIHHSRPGAGFALIPNGTLRDERLSFAARGVLAYLLSLPDGWNTTADAESRRARQLRGRRGEGRDSMRRIYAELKEHGYIRYVRTQDNGTWSTELHVSDRPHTDARVTGVPETRMSVPPAEMPEADEYEPDTPGTFPQVAPMYGSPGVGTPVVGTPVHRQAVHSYEDRPTEDEGKIRAVDGEAGDLGGPGVAPRLYEDHGQGQDQEHSRASLTASRKLAEPANSRLNDQTPADEAQEFPLHDSDSATDGSSARESEAEEHRQRVLDDFAEWMRNHPEAVAAP